MPHHDNFHNLLLYVKQSSHGNTHDSTLGNFLNWKIPDSSLGNPNCYVSIMNDASSPLLIIRITKKLK